MSKLRSLFTWFRDVHVPTRAHRDLTMTRARAGAVDEALHAPHFYVFDYQGRTKPKAYTGPFDNQASAKAWITADIAEFGGRRQSYKIRRLTLAQFKKIWGVAPHPSGDRRGMASSDTNNWRVYG